MKVKYVSLLLSAFMVPACVSGDNAEAAVGKDGPKLTKNKAIKDKYYPPPPTRKDLPKCNLMNRGNIPKYHTDDTCDRAYHNSSDKRRDRHYRYHALLQTGVMHIPDEKTVHCPTEAAEWQPAFGHDTKWLVENQSSGPVVVIFKDEDGLEYSAYNSDIRPPQNDPHAILKPGAWMALDVYEGHIFYVRELGSDGKLGDIVLQHQPGLIPIKNRFGATLPCQKPKLPPKRALEQLSPKRKDDIVHQALERVDPEPKEKLPPKPDSMTEEEQRHPDYERAPSHYHELCHTQYKGFRNTLDNCPLHVFYVGMSTPVTGKMECAEEFKFHLGLHETPNDYMFDWHSQTKFESTYVGHSFVARLASNPDIVVDSYTVQPTIVRDCPKRSKEAVKKPAAEATPVVIIPPIAQKNLTSTVVTLANVASM